MSDLQARLGRESADGKTNEQQSTSPLLWTDAQRAETELLLNDGARVSDKINIRPRNIASAGSREFGRFRIHPEGIKAPSPGLRVGELPWENRTTRPSS